MLLVMPANGVGLARSAVQESGVEGPNVMIDILPVADIVPGAIDGDARTWRGFLDDHRKQFFWKLVGAIVVGAVGEDDRQLTGMTMGPDQMVRSSLAGRMG